MDFIPIFDTAFADDSPTDGRKRGLLKLLLGGDKGGNDCLSITGQKQHLPMTKETLLFLILRKWIQWKCVCDSKNIKLFS